VRSATVEDLEALYRLDVACFEPQFRFTREMMRWSVLTEGAVVPMEEDEQGLSGFAIAHEAPQDGVQSGYLLTIDVAERARRNGLGRRLLRALESMLRERGADQMLLHVFTRNHAAVELYESEGYERLRRVPRFYGRDLDAWLYRKALR
jgi:ribosomal-protein-alanine N-acetyltransferase